MLDLIQFIIYLSILYVLFYKKKYNNFFLNKILLLSGLILIITIISIFFFDKSTAQPQFMSSIALNVINKSLTYFNLGWDLKLINFQESGVDGISIFFVILTSFLSLLCFLDIWSNKTKINNMKEFILYFLILELFLIITFITFDLLIFYIFFESVLIPMFLIIGIWGSRERKVRADFYFFLYTLFGSIFLFFSILIIFFEAYSTKFFILNGIFFSFPKECFVWSLSFLAFSIKIPMFPFHIWLPEAHVEAPTSGSVVLAGLLLKLGGYGCLRMVLPLLPNASYFFFPVVSVCCIISIIYASLTTIRQTDLKRIIAYSSVAHMNVVLIGIFTCNLYGIQGSIFLMLAHGIVASALFFIIGHLYKQHGTRLLSYYGGLVSKMPLFSLYLLVFCLANIGTPGTCNFVGELIILISLVDNNFFVLWLTSLSLVLSVAYTIWFYNKITFGNIKINYIQNWKDVDKKENFIFGILTFITIFLGFFPNQILDITYTSSFYIVELIRFKTQI